MNPYFLIHTQYYHKPITWFKRGFEFLIAVCVLYSAFVVDIDGGYVWAKFIFFTVVSIYIFARPVDELALGKRTLFYIQKSAIPYFTKIEQYDLSQIKSIGCGGVYDTDTELAGRGTRTNRLEIIFNDNSSKALDIKIYKKELKSIVTSVATLLQQKNQHKTLRSFLNLLTVYILLY